MTDRERHQLRGPVQSVRSEFALADPRTSVWEAPREGPTLTFDSAGRQLDHRVFDQGQTTSSLDERGLRTTVGQSTPSIPRQPGLEYGLSLNAAVRFDVLTRYDGRERPVEVVFRNAEQEALRRIVLEYDDVGQIAHETVLMGADPLLAMSDTYGPVDSISTEQLQELRTAFNAIMPDGVFFAREYAYDERGLVTQLRERMGRMSEHRRTFTYDDHRNLLEEHWEGTDREGDVDSEGNLVTSNERSEESWSRYEYRYDERGNWVEKVVSQRVAPDPEFHRSSLERRTITYFD